MTSVLFSQQKIKIFANINKKIFSKKNQDFHLEKKQTYFLSAIFFNFLFVKIKIHLF